MNRKPHECWWCMVSIPIFVNFQNIGTLCIPLWIVVPSCEGHCGIVREQQEKWESQKGYHYVPLKSTSTNLITSCNWFRDTILESPLTNSPTKTVSFLTPFMRKPLGRCIPCGVFWPPLIACGSCHADMFSRFLAFDFVMLNWQDGS